MSKKPSHSKEERPKNRKANTSREEKPKATTPKKGGGTSREVRTKSDNQKPRAKDTKSPNREVKPRKVSSTSSNMASTATAKAPGSTVTAVQKSRIKKSQPSLKTSEDLTFDEADQAEAPPYDEVNDELFKLVSKSLTNNTWYHGIMPRSECDDLLKDEGDFLVRKTKIKKSAVYCVSVRHKEETKHIPIFFMDMLWKIKGITRTTLAELVDFVREEKIPIPPTGVILINAVPRPPYYILHEHVTTKKKIGAGAFGEVFTGTLKKKKDVVPPPGVPPAELAARIAPTTTVAPVSLQDEEVDVAVKKIKGSVNKTQMEAFVKEAKLMLRLNHANIVRFYGVAPQEEPIMIVLELAKGGGLKDYCKKQKYDLKIDQLINWAKDGARGMCYLAGRQIIHRDLAARNCLLGANLEVKISDFGLSVADQSELKMDKLRSMPIKWLAPETLKMGKFTKKTDVWSFGILLWEIFNYCKTDPFPGENNVQARKKILSGNDPMGPPPAMTPVADSVMKQCFTQDPDTRPDFEAILKFLAPDEKPPAALAFWENYQL